MIQGEAGCWRWESGQYNATAGLGLASITGLPASSLTDLPRSLSTSGRVPWKQEGGVSVPVDCYLEFLNSIEKMCAILKLLMLLGHSSLCFCFIIL